MTDALIDRVNDGLIGPVTDLIGPVTDLIGPVTDLIGLGMMKFQ